jgi:outer membrane protein
LENFKYFIESPLTIIMQTSNMQKPIASSSSPIIISIITCVILFTIYAAINQMYFTPRIAYVNTGKLMVGFAESNKVEKEIKAEDDKWQAQYKQLKDSLEAAVKTMSKDYNSAIPAKKKEMQDMLSARNQEVNNYKQVNTRKMEELRQKKMQGVFEKVNVYLGEYGKKHRYTIIFGTMMGGNIVYADDRKVDITEDIMKGLNERYK